MCFRQIEHERDRFAIVLDRTSKIVLGVKHVTQAKLCFGVAPVQRQGLVVASRGVGKPTLGQPRVP